MILKMKNNIIITQVLLITLFCACKRQSNIAIIQQNNKVEQTTLNKKNEQNNDCKSLFKELISDSSIENPFIDNFNISIDKEEEGKILLKLFDQSDAQENAVGWIVFDTKSKKLIDITNDIENPIELNYDIKLWNKIIDCYFNSNTNYKISKLKKSECNDTTTEDGSQEECFFEDTSIHNIYIKTIKDAKIKNFEFLLPSLPLKDINKEINQDGLISINYKISPKIVEIEFLFEGGITTLTLEQKKENVKRVISYSAD